MLFPSVLLFFQQFDLLGNALPQPVPQGILFVFPHHVPNVVYPTRQDCKFGVVLG